MRAAPTAEEVARVLRYDRSAGDLIWRHRNGAGARNDLAGTVAGTPHKDGYLAVQIGKRKYLAHRVVWLLLKGEWPSRFLDHRDGVRTNNLIDNLRLATKTLNAENQRIETRGSLGVDFVKRTGKWRARITVKGVVRSLGSFSSQDLAQAAYLAAKRQQHEGCTI